MGSAEFSGSEVAKVIFATISKTGQRFGVNYIALVLVGSRSTKVQRFGHIQNPTHGALKQYSFDQIRVWINELLAQGYLLKASTLYPTLRLLDKAREAESDSAEVVLSQPKPELERKSTLDRGESVSITMALFKKGKSVAEIAVERGLAQGTILSHLADAYQQGEAIDIDQFVPEQKQEVIAEAFQKHGVDYLSPVRRDLGQAYSWEDLKWVRAKLLRQEQAAA